VVNLIWINQTKSRQPRQFIENFIEAVILELKKKKIWPYKANLELTLVFLEASEAQQLNAKYRQKKYATDVLSFAGAPGHLGELVLCPEVLRRQSKEHGLLYREELAYMVIHGILHLLGYDHEKGPKQAREMFAIQDQIFEKLI
jgi:probable rRNA maturation factor